jgi:VanZ family protein
LAAVLFGAFIILIIIVADRGEGERWWSFLTKLPQGDKIGHVGLMGTLSFLCNSAIRPRPAPWWFRRLTWVTFVLLVLLSLEEISQAWVSARTCDWFDWLADLAGLALGQWVAATARIRWLASKC